MISVLCVDDEPALLTLAKTFLERDAELRVETVTSGPQVLTRLRSNSYDAIVADYQMPDMDGIQLLKLVRHDEPKGIPFILFTGRGREEVAIEAINNGADYYLQKGDEPAAQYQELAHKIKQAVKRCRAEHRIRESEQKFRTFADFTHDWEYWEDLFKGFVYITPSCEAITGYTAEEFQYDPALIDRIVLSDDREVYDAHKREAAISQSVESTEFRIVRKDGKIRWINQHCQKVSDPDGKPLGMRAGNTDITDRKLFEENLQSSELQYRRLFEAAQEGILILDFDTGTIVDANPFILTVLGYPKEAVLGRKIGDMEPVTGKRLSEEAFQRFKEQGSVRFENLLFQARDGSTIIVDFVGSVYPVADHKVIQCSIRDISDRVRMEQALKASEARLRSIIRVAPIGIGVIAKRTILEVNDGICRLTGYTPEELVGQSTKLLFPTQEEFEHAGQEGIDQIKKTGTASFETRWKRKDRSIIDIQFSATPLNPADLTAGITFTVMNETERKKAELILQESETKYRDLVENANTSILQINPEGRITFFNEFAQHFFGFSEEEILGKPMVGTVIPAKEASTGRDLAYILKEEMIHPEKYTQHESEAIKKNGGRFWISWRNKPLYDLAGNLTGIICFGTDITERRKAEEALFVANKKLNLLNSITRHDILNQLTVLFGYIEMSKSMMQDQEFQFFIEREKQTTNAIRQMISFTKDYQDIGLYRPQWQNLDTIVHLLAKTLDFHGVVLIINLRYLEIFADPLLEKVVYTLIDNALRHGRSLTSIKFSYKITDAGCIILCDDNGIGIKTAEKEKIFEQGFGKHTGFGLFLAREILGITGFTIKETGIFGKGARFEIFVPEGAFQVNTKPALTDGGSTGT